MPNHARELPLTRRLAEASLVAAVVTVAYFKAAPPVAASGTAFRHVLDAEVPFLPESVWVYLPGYWAGFLLSIWAVKDARGFRAALVGLASLTFFALPFFVLDPIAGPRPPAPLDDTVTDALVRWLYTHDPVANTFPSLHVANSTFCAVVTTASNRRLGLVAWALAAGVAVSVLTLKQHWVVDVPAGWALATVGAGVWRAQLAAPALLATKRPGLVPLPRRIRRD